MDEQCAEALGWGMPYDLFWRGPLSAYDIYLHKARLELSYKRQEQNLSGYITGLYVQQALLSVYHLFNGFAGKDSKVFHYPAKPYSLWEEESQQDRQKREEIRALIAEHNLIIKASTEGKP